MLVAIKPNTFLTPDANLSNISLLYLRKTRQHERTSTPIRNERLEGMFKLKDKSLTLTSSVVLAIIFIMIISITQLSSYKSQKTAYLEDMERTARTFGVQTQSNLQMITSIHKQLLEEKTASADLGLLKLQFNAMTTNELIANSYAFMPELIEKDGKTYLNIMQASDNLYEAGYTPGKLYELSPEYIAGYEKVLTEGFTQLEPYTDDIGTWVTFLTLVKDGNNEAVSIYAADFDYDQVEAKINRMLLESSMGALLLILIAIVLVVWLIRLALKPLKRLAEVSALAAQGNLTITIPVNNSNEIGRVAAAFNEMIISLRHLTHNIRITSSEVSASSANMQESAEQTAQATQEVAESIQEVAVGTDTQLQSLQECQRAMTEMTIGIQRIAESSSSVSEMAGDTTELAAAGEIVIEGTVGHMQTISDKMTNTVTALHELEQMSGQIGEILSMIEDVANQTNLLALNASIEAARAGEHGKGFAVVAHEIRKLAERSKDSSEQIGAILNGISSRTGEAVQSMEQAVVEAREGSDVSRQAGQSFRAILEAIRKVSEQVQEVSAASEQMSAGSEQIAASLDQLENIASDSSGHAQRVAAASEEQLASMQEVASSSAQLNDLASTLNQAISKFKTE